MFSDLHYITASYIHHGATNALCRIDYDIIVFCHVKGVERFDFFTRSVKYTLINRVGHTVVDKLCKYQAIFAFVEHLKCVCRERQSRANICVSSEYSIDMPCELCPFILIYCMRDIGG